MSGTNEDIDLVALCLKGEQKAQKNLFDRYKGTMMTICRRYARDNSEAEDLLLIAFNRVFKYLHNFNGSGSLYGWIKTITVHASLRYLEKNKSHRFHEEVNQHYDVVSDELDAMDILSEEEILHLIRKMPDGYRTIFNLYVIDGFSHREISEQLGIAEGTSRSQLLKARKWLREHFERLTNIRT